jgi:hypothetical protein
MSLTKELRSIIDDPCVGHRPFVCRGLPSRCTVLIVGENPGTTMNTNWWDWWKGDTIGFDKNEFMRAYRKQKKLKPGAKLRAARACMERLGDDMHHLRCLETNLWSKERQGGHGPEKEPNNMKVVRLLVSKMSSLRAVITHGANVENAVGPILPTGVLVLPPLPNLRMVRYGVIDDIASKIKSL